MIDLLYDNPLVLRNGVRMVPCLPCETGYVQYCRRMPRDLSGSVHYEVYAETKINGDKEETIGYRVVLHTEYQTLEGDKNGQRRLVSFLKTRIHEKPEFKNGRFSLCQ